MTTGFARKPTPKPSLDAKLVAWARAYHAVLDEMVEDVDYGTESAPVVTTAATVAASLVAGTNLED